MTAKLNLVIVSAGKFGREVLSWVNDAIGAGAPWRVKGFLDDRSHALEGKGYDVPILGPVESYAPASDEVFIAAIGEPQPKRKYCTQLLARGARFANLIHPLARVGQNVQLGQGLIMPPFSSITCDAHVGSFVSFGLFSGTAHDTVIGDWCQLSGHCGINGNAILEEGVFLGSHAAILPRVKVGAWAFIGAGSVVIRNVKPRTKVFGNPAMQIGLVEGPS